MWVLFVIGALAHPNGDPTAAQRAKEIYENGSELYAEGLYVDAIAAFQESYRLARVHELLLNIANCYERLQRLDDAVVVLNRYRAFAHPSERQQIKARIQAIQQRIKTTPGYVGKRVEPLPLLPPPTMPKTPAPAE